MPIIKKNDVTPERPVIIVLYGTPGTGKTSVATTAFNPLLIDTFAILLKRAWMII